MCQTILNAGRWSCEGEALREVSLWESNFAH